MSVQDYKKVLSNSLVERACHDIFPSPPSSSLPLTPISLSLPPLSLPPPSFLSPPFLSHLPSFLSPPFLSHPPFSPTPFLFHPPFSPTPFSSIPLPTHFLSHPLSFLPTFSSTLFLSLPPPPYTSFPPSPSLCSYLRQVEDETLRWSTASPWAAQFSDIDMEVAGYEIPAQTPMIQALGVALYNETQWKNTDV